MSRSDRIVIAAGGGALVLAAAAAWILLAPMLAPADGAVLPSPGASSAFVGLVPSVPASAPATGTIVVDVQGAVVEPGVRELPAGARVSDAISAAGGYAADADLAAASATINLAQPLVDGAQVRVPRIGEGVAAAASAPAGAGGAGGGGSGPIDLNTATPEELEALPGIGPVTVQKIVAARAERPFASLEDAVERGILNRGQLEDIQGLATAG
ncbi:MAG TPA: helix-hairpin-helix domain-containing protein [Candidatus Limnocylindria bacterium]|nr:helix-hairpin-helix domain-containing protein [Candidatus Limnocylindria bacterium]